MSAAFVPPPGSVLHVFARAPEPGRTKTRLASRIGPEAAAGLAIAFLEDVCAATRTVAVKRVLSIAGDASHPALVRLLERERAASAAMEVTRQGEGDLGARMAHAISSALAAGADRAAIISSDVPLVDPVQVRAAFAALERADVAIGPAEDGGYWLVGARKPVPWLFSEMEWGTASVLAETEKRLETSGLPWARVATAWDVDEPSDLDRLRGALVAHPALAPSTRCAIEALARAMDR